ncbi:hypothetical protein Drorol1_Dr00008136 [Drosera rotundifolia]
MGIRFPTSSSHTVERKVVHDSRGELRASLLTSGKEELMKVLTKGICICSGPWARSQEWIGLRGCCWAEHSFTLIIEMFILSGSVIIILFEPSLVTRKISFGELNTSTSC